MFGKPATQSVCVYADTQRWVFQKQTSPMVSANTWFRVFVEAEGRVAM